MSSFLEGYVSLLGYERGRVRQAGYGVWRLLFYHSQIGYDIIGTSREFWVVSFSGGSMIELRTNRQHTLELPIVK